MHDFAEPIPIQSRNRAALGRRLPLGTRARSGRPTCGSAAIVVVSALTRERIMSALRHFSRALGGPESAVESTVAAGARPSSMRTRCAQGNQASRQSSMLTTTSNSLETASLIPRTKLHKVQDLSCVVLHNVQRGGVKTKQYRGWKIYRTTSGSNNGLRSLNAKHPLRVSKLSAVINGSEAITLAHIKRDIDAIETSGVPA